MHARALWSRSLAERGARGAVQDFLVDIQASERVDWGGMAPILVARAASPDEVPKLIALRWLREFVELAKTRLLPHYAPILEAVLPSLAHPNPELASVRPELQPCTALVGRMAQLSCARAAMGLPLAPWRWPPCWAVSAYAHVASWEGSAWLPDVWPGAGGGRAGRRPAGGPGPLGQGQPDRHLRGGQPPVEQPPGAASPGRPALGALPPAPAAGPGAQPTARRRPMCCPSWPAGLLLRWWPLPSGPAALPSRQCCWRACTGVAGGSNPVEQRAWVSAACACRS